jgi:hypothetical protein
LGADSTFVAMDKHPEEFAHIKVMIALRPISARAFVEKNIVEVAATDEKLHWIEGTDQRFRGYTYFGEHPTIAIDWFDTYMK